MTPVILALLMIRFIIWMIPCAEKWIQKLTRQLKRKLKGNMNARIFDNNYIEVKSFYLQQFGIAPCVSYINNLEVVQAYDH